MEKHLAGLGEVGARFLRWAEHDPGVRAILLLGSQARGDSDEWSDLDFTVVVVDKTRYISDVNWLDNCGTVLVSHTERTDVGGHIERRVVFEDGTDASFCLVGREWLECATREQDTLTLLGKGARILLDKDGGLLEVLAAVQSRPPTVCNEAQFINLVSRYWYEALWTAKRLRRGELLKGVISCNGTMKLLFFRLMTWHRPSPNSLDTSFARCEREDAWRILLEDTRNFERSSRIVAAHFGHKHPDTSRVVALIATLWTER